MNTLHLIFQAHRYSSGGGIQKPADHISQEIALKHFRNGNIAIAYNRLDEIIYVAGLHGWKVTTEGDPKDA